MNINCKIKPHRLAVHIAFCSVLIAGFSFALAAQSAEPPAQTSEPAKPTQKTPPFPRQGTDMETSMQEQHEYMQWMHENNENVSTVLVKLKSEIEGSPRKLISHAKAKEIGRTAGVKLEPERLTVSDGWQVMNLPKRMTQKVVEVVCNKLKQHPDVLACDPNGAVFAFSVPTDTLYSQQWSFKAGPGSANIEKSWETTTGVASTVIAVLDSGITNHEDLPASRILPGYDFVFNSVVANDSDPAVPSGITGARDANPSDPGNWVTAAERSTGVLSNCPVIDSTWHGSHITGIIGATANNLGVAGINWAAKLLPVRVLGKCGNPTNAPDDLAAALQWAAGVDIGTPAINLNPAQVINMSLGGTGVCPSIVQDAINKATAKGAVVIAAAGNNGVSQSYWPANCSNVLTVVATNEIGNKESYSNWGAGVGVSAPGANILSSVNPGTTLPVAGSAYKTYSGTSQAAAHVSGIASLMLAVKPSLTPFEVREIIKASAKKFARGSAIILGSCSSGSCGTGIVNAAEAVKQAKAGNVAKPAVADAYEFYFGPYVYLLANLPDGRVVGWGNNSGQLGGENPAKLLTLMPASNLTQVEHLFAGTKTSWFLLSSGEAYAMGMGSYCDESLNIDCRDINNHFSFFGGDPMAQDSGVPIRTSVLDNVKQISQITSYDQANYFPTVYAITQSGGVLAWGYEKVGAGTLGLGLPTTNNFVDVNVVQTPTLIQGLPPISQIQAVPAAAFALDENGHVWGWGYNGADAPCNKFGSGAPDTSSVPIQINGLSNIIQISVSSKSFTDTGVALKQDGTAWEWGCKIQGIDSPVQINIDRVVAVKKIGNITYAIRDDGSLWMWPITTTITLPSVTQLLPSGMRKFMDEDLVLMADGHLVELRGLATSAISPTFAQNTLGSGYSGRLNLANASIGNDSELQVSISRDIPSISVGQDFNYIVTVSNLGTGAAENSIVSVALPTEVRINSVPAGCSVAGQIITCNLGNVAASYASSLSINVQALSAASTTATAYISSDAYDYSSADNADGVDIVIQAPASATDGGDVPTLPEWGVILMASLLLANMVWVNRRKYRN